MNQLPSEFLKRMERQLGSEMADFLRAMAEPAVRGIRLNPEKSFDGMERITAGKPVPWTEGAYILPADCNAGATVFHEAGAFYLQEPAAMIPAEVMDARPGEWILDLCAAPGGKSTQMAAAMRGEGVIVCCEPVAKRAKVLSRNIERMGIRNSIVICEYPENIPRSWDGLFDGVMVDAPCSGEGMFRREPKSREEWTPEHAAGCAERQRGILREAARLVRPGGRIVYSTCTWNPAENGENVLHFLREQGDFTAEAFQIAGMDRPETSLLCLPHRMEGEGQFIAKMRRTGDAGIRKGCFPQLPSRTERSVLADAVPGMPEANGKFGETLVLAPEGPELKGVHVLRIGLHLGSARGKNVNPDHAFALSSGAAELAAAELDAREAERYIHGEEIEGNDSGWILMRYGGIPLGWGKGSGGRIRNHYPKGLRKEYIAAAIGNGAENYRKS